MSSFIKNNTWIASALSAGLALTSGCNTTESAFYIGDSEDIKLSSDLTDPQVRLEADGAIKEIEVLSNVKWNITPPEHPFTAVATSTEGNGIIKVSATKNFNTSTTPTSELIVKAVDFPEKQYKVTLIQSQLVFKMDKESYPTVQERGGQVNLRFKSSIDWKFDIISGMQDWIEFTPGLNGNGSWDEITVHAVWKPNYTMESRELRLRLKPAEKEWLEQGVSAQDTIVLTQVAGTLPSSINLKDSEAERNSVPLSLSYDSKSPVEKVEVKVSKAASIDESWIFTVPYPAGTDNYPEIAELTFLLDGLESGVPYNLTPIVTSMVGTNEGSAIRIQTRGNINFENPKLDKENTFINPEVTGVEASFKVISEVELKSFKATLYKKSDNSLIASQMGSISTVLDETNTPISWIGELSWANKNKLDQNTEYYFDLRVTGVDPNEIDPQNTFEFQFGFEYFTTLFRQPEQGDNKPIQ